MLYQELTIHRRKHGPKQHSRPYPSALFLRTKILMQQQQSKVFHKLLALPLLSSKTLTKKHWNRKENEMK